MAWDVLAKPQSLPKPASTYKELFTDSNLLNDVSNFNLPTVQYLIVRGLK